MQDTFIQSMQARFHYFGHGTDSVRLSIYTRETIGGPMNLINRLDNFATDSFQYIDDEFLVVLNEFQVRYIVDRSVFRAAKVCPPLKNKILRKLR